MRSADEAAWLLSAIPFMLTGSQYMVLRRLEWVETLSSWQLEVELAGEKIDEGLEVSR
jgi:hypothetical protein